MQLKQSLKRVGNLMIRPFGLRLERIHRDRISGSDLFPDVRQLISIPDPVCFDVGANEGQTIIELRKCFPSPTIWAFEPGSEAFTSLVAKNYGDRVILNKIALGETPGTGLLNKFDQSVFNSLLEPTGAEVRPIKELQINAVESVEIDTVDQFAARHQIDRIDLLKSDTQGFDLNVIRGAQNLFESDRIRYLMIEINMQDIYENQSSSYETERFLRSFNFNLIGYYEIVRMNNCISWCTALYGKASQGPLVFY